VEGCSYLSSAELISLAGTHFSLQLHHFSNSWISFFRRCSGVIFLCGTGGIFLYIISKRKRRTFFRERALARLLQAGQSLIDFLRGEELVEEFGEDHYNIYPRYFGPSQIRGSGYEADVESDYHETPPLGSKFIDVIKRKRISFSKRDRRSFIHRKPLSPPRSINSHDPKEISGQNIPPGRTSTDEADVVEMITIVPGDFPVRGVPDGESFSEEDPASSTPSMVGKTEGPVMQDMVSQAKEVRKLIKEISFGSQESDFSLELYSSDYPSLDTDLKTAVMCPDLEINEDRFQSHIEGVNENISLPIPVNSSPAAQRIIRSDVWPEVLSLEDPWEWDSEGLGENFVDELNFHHFETTLEEISYDRKRLSSETDIIFHQSRLPPIGQSSSFSS